MLFVIQPPEGSIMIFIFILVHLFKPILFVLVGNSWTRLRKKIHIYKILKCQYFLQLLIINESRDWLPRHVHRVNELAKKCLKTSIWYFDVETIETIHLLIQKCCRQRSIHADFWLHLIKLPQYMQWEGQDCISALIGWVLLLMWRLYLAQRCVVWLYKENDICDYKWVSSVAWKWSLLQIFPPSPFPHEQTGTVTGLGTCKITLNTLKDIKLIWKKKKFHSLQI